MTGPEKAPAHRPGTGRDWTDAEIETLWRWGEAAVHPPFELLAIQFDRTPQALRLKLHRLRRERARS